MRRLADRRGLALIFDALMFLAAMAALCSAAMVVGGPVEDEMPGPERIAKAHSALLRATVQMPGDEGGAGAWVPISDLIVRNVTAPGSWELVPWARAPAYRALSFLLGEGWGFEWSVAVGGQACKLIADGIPGGGDVVCSNLASRHEASGLGLEYRLRAWRA